MSRSKKKKVVMQVPVRLPSEIPPREGIDPSLETLVRTEIRAFLREETGPRRINDGERAMAASMTSASPQTVTFLENVHKSLNEHCARLHEALLVMRQFNTERLGSLPPPVQDAQKTPEPSCATSRIWKILDDASNLMTQLEIEIKRAQEL